MGKITTVAAKSLGFTPEQIRAAIIAAAVYADPGKIAKVRPVWIDGHWHVATSGRRSKRPLARQHGEPLPKVGEERQLGDRVYAAPDLSAGSVSTAATIIGSASGCRCIRWSATRALTSP